MCTKTAFSMLVLPSSRQVNDSYSNILLNVSNNIHLFALRIHLLELLRQHESHPCLSATLSQAPLFVCSVLQIMSAQSNHFKENAFHRNCMHLPEQQQHQTVQALNSTKFYNACQRMMSPKAQSEPWNSTHGSH